MSSFRHHPKLTRLGPKLRAIRKGLKLSQTQMKHRLNFNGDYGRISEYERGKRQPNILLLLAYARAGNVSLESLVDDEMSLQRFQSSLS